MFALIITALIGGIITLICAWYWFGFFSVILAPFGAGAAAVFAGLVLAYQRSKISWRLDKQIPDFQSDDPRREANDVADIPRERRRA